MAAWRHSCCGVAWVRQNDDRPTTRKLYRSSEFEPVSRYFLVLLISRKVFEKAKELRLDGRGTLLFVDEIHRFNRAQQDGFLPMSKTGRWFWSGVPTGESEF